MYRYICVFIGCFPSESRFVVGAVTTYNIQQPLHVSIEKSCVSMSNTSALVGNARLRDTLYASTSFRCNHSSFQLYLHLHLFRLPHTLMHFWLGSVFIVRSWVFLLIFRFTLYSKTRFCFLSLREMGVLIIHISKSEEGIYTLTQLVVQNKYICTLRASACYMHMLLFENFGR